MADRVTCSDGCCIFEGADGWTNIGTPRERALQYRAPIAVKFCPETGEALLPDGRTEPRPLQAHIDVLEMTPSAHACDGCREGVAQGLVAPEAVAT